MTVAVSLGAGFVPPAWLQAVMRLIAKPASKRTAVVWSIPLGDDDFFMVQKYMRLLAGKLSVLRREPDFCQVYGSVADDWLSQPCGTFRLISPARLLWDSSSLCFLGSTSSQSDL